MNIFKKLWAILGIKAAPKRVVPNDGMTAQHEGYRLDDNPYRPHTAMHSIWRDDWLFSSGRFR
jgi:hypothetical protein